MQTAVRRLFGCVCLMLLCYRTRVERFRLRIYSHSSHVMFELGFCLFVCVFYLVLYDTFPRFFVRTVVECVVDVMLSLRLAPHISHWGPY